MRWYVVNTLAHQEDRARVNLARQGYEAWLPRIMRSRRHARRFDVIRAPLFPGYLFVRLDLDRQQWRSVRGTFGVRQLIAFSERPAPLPVGFLEALQACANGQDVVHAPEENLRPGQTVRVLSGPLADQVGTLIALDRKERVSLLLRVLGREVTASVSRASVMPAA
jgi:transcriptional antiterminator RfaH